jgi:thiol-disulfide isomerase/thioredoxin
MPSRRTILQILAAGPLVAALPATMGLAQAGAPAPDFTAVESWLNTPAPLSLAGLRGKVVLVDFWTYSCINCRRTVPYLNRWQAEYGAQGLQVVGIHSPEFGFEHARRNVADSVATFGIRFPVGQDNGFRTWRAWGNQAWPSFYLLDQTGRVVLVREGEGHAHELEGAIRALLGMTSSGFAPVPGEDPDLSRIGTWEIYFGATHPTPQDRAQRPRPGEVAYTFPTSSPAPGQYQLEGTWQRDGEALVLRSARGGLRVRFSAAKFHLVAAATETTTLRLAVDGATIPPTEIGRPTLYTLLDGTAYGDHLLDIQCDTPGLSLFSATFG